MGTHSGTGAWKVVLIACETKFHGFPVAMPRTARAMDEHLERPCQPDSRGPAAAYTGASYAHVNHVHRAAAVHVPADVQHLCARSHGAQHSALRESRCADVPSCTVVWYVMRACALPSFSRWNTPTSVKTSEEPVERANAPFSITTFEKLAISSWTAGEMSPLKTGRAYGADGDIAGWRADRVRRGGGSQEGAR